jgi:hypothetical protein
VDLHSFGVDLYSFCMKNCGATGARLLIPLEGITAAPFLRAFRKKRPSMQTPARDWPMGWVMHLAEKLLFFML